MHATVPDGRPTSGMTRMSEGGKTTTMIRRGEPLGADDDDNDNNNEANEDNEDNNDVDKDDNDDDDNDDNDDVTTWERVVLHSMLKRRGALVLVWVIAERQL